jgi:hypothetical protein
MKVSLSVNRVVHVRTQLDSFVRFTVLLVSFVWTLSHGIARGIDSRHSLRARRASPKRESEISVETSFHFSASEK